ncbi:cupin domain-containing protein [Ideonella sp.]|uniref:cupin domain-containing protein n=1 Tax=Ideonella sp. TaxID=1929293 RepID=UPI003BB7DABF
MSRIIRFDLPDVAPERDQPRPERREVGAPDRSTWTLYESAAEGVAAGIWDCEPGRWRIEFGPNEHEYFHVLHGLARVHDEAGGVVEVGPGQAVMIPANFRGSFEVLTPMRKHFVIIEK